jgi:hypothetical protein
MVLTDEHQETNNVATLDEKLRPILDMLTAKAWRNAARDQAGEFLLHPSALAPGTSLESIHETLQALYTHARRWAPGLDVPFFVPPIRIDVVDAAGNFAVDEESYATIGISAEFVNNAAAVLMILSHEACHHILLQSGLRRVDDAGLDEVTTDLAMFVCGFGELVLRGHAHVQRYGGGGTRVHLGYLGSDEYRRVYDYVLAKRVAGGLPAHPVPGARTAKGPVPPLVLKQEATDGTVELWCGEAMCKRPFRATLRRKGKPWPVQCLVCGVYLYPADVLKNAAANELEPQRAELRLFSDGRLVEGTSAALWKLAHPADVRAPAPAHSTASAKVDGAAILAEMLDSASPTVDAPAAMQRPEPPSRSPVALKPILVLVILIILGLVTAWVIFSGR